MSELTQEKLKELVNYDPETGIFTWLVKPARNVHVGDIVGSKYTTGYIYTEFSDKRYSAHRLAWLYVYGYFPKHNIDHINGIKDDNRIVNLRDVTQSINQQNQKKARADSKTGILGASLYQGKYRAQIRESGKKKHLGCFDIPQEAGKAYLTAKRQLHTGCTI